MTDDQHPDRLPASQDRPVRRIIVTKTPPTLPEQQALPPAAPQTTGRRINWWGVGCLVLVVGCLVIVAIPVIAGVDVINQVRQGVDYMVDGFQQGFESEPVASVTSAQTVINSIQPLGQVVSVEMQLAKAAMSVSIQQGVLNACSFSANYVAQGAITAGIDLTQVGATNVSYNALTNTYTIILPRPQLTSCRIDFVDQYGESFTLCAVDWDAARQLGQYLALNEFREDAIEGNILGRAEQQTTLVIGNFVRSLTGSNVEVQYQEGESPLPPSCRPDPPEPWIYDAEKDAWIQPNP